MQKIPLSIQTAYADLVDRSASAAFGAAFQGQGDFVAKTVSGRKYWYFQFATPEGRKQKYVGPETPELLDQIARHKQIRNDERDRAQIVSMLVRSAYLPRPLAPIGQVIEALAQAGVFRLRAVLIGTLAYQTYAAMLGARLPMAAVQTGDVDIAQHRTISVAIKDETPSPLETLRQVDASFRDVPSINDPRRSTSYMAAAGLRVDFLTPNRGADTGKPEHLPALATDAHPLRFLDFLIHNPVHAVVLHGAGIHVTVPAPERYALHKLILSRQPERENQKRSKDALQAESLLAILVDDRPHELRTVWEEASKRGKKWKKLMAEGLSMISVDARDGAIKCVGETRALVPGLNIEFSDTPPRYDSNRDVVFEVAMSLGKPHQCSISIEALEDHFGLEKYDGKAALRVFRDNRGEIERLFREKYLNEPISDIEGTLLTSIDVDRLKHRLK